MEPNMMAGYSAGMQLPFDPAWFLVFLAWTIVWKGLALWHSAQRDDRLWFIALLVINTGGILEIVYLFAFAKKKFSDLFPIGKIE
jgi:methionyl-tRNA synthetase